jgi:hypothetical protein
MAGIVQKNMFNHAKELDKMTKMMPPKMRQAFERIVLAGKKIMYSKETQPVVDKFMNSDAPVAEKLGLGVANIIVMIDNKANGAVPKDILIPAATVLLFDAADFLRKTGETVTVSDIGNAYEMMFFGIFQAYGMEPDQVEQVFDKMGGQSQVGAEEQAPAPEEQGNV